MKKILMATLVVALGGMTLSAQTSREKAREMLSKLTLDEKISLMMDSSPAIERVGIPQFNWWSEALHGVARAGRATVLPQTIGMAATFDDEALERAFTMVSDEARAKFNGFRDGGEGIKRYEGLAFWTPNVNIFRDPRWGRGQETYGEDPYLTTRMGRAVVRGLQGDRDGKYLKTLAGAKHFAVHSGPEWNRHSFDARDIDPRDLRETYLPAFKALVDEDVAQVMCAYNRYEGEPCCSSKKLLQQILRGEWGYKNIIVSDCWAIRDFISDWAHNTHPSDAHASSDAVISGTDLECGPVYKSLRKAYDQGLITEEVIDSAVIKLLDFRYRLGEIDNPSDVPWNNYTAETHLDTSGHRALALEMARKSMTLLKNNGILPLSPSTPLKVMVMGPNAADSVMQWGNYNGFPAHTVTVLEGIRNYIPSVGYDRGCDLVVSDNRVSRFDSFDGGMKALYWNNTEAKGRPVAEAVYTTPVSLDGGGATVFAPGVELNNFSARLSGTFVAPAAGDYIIEFESSKGNETVSIDGTPVIERRAEGRNNHKASHIFTCAAPGERHDITVDFTHFDGDATLKFDLLSAESAEPDFSEADLVIFVGGISPKLEGEEMKVSVPGFRGGDRESIELPAVQRKLLERIHEAGKKIIYVNCSGSAVGLSREDEICDAVLQAWYPGQAGGQAVAEVIFGDLNPGGRLPVTFYRDDSQLPDFEDYSMASRTYRYFKGSPLYPFGHGLSYTTFNYGQPVYASSIQAGSPLKVTVPVSNTGSCEGDEVVMVYVSNPSDPSGPIKSLKGYRRVTLSPGATENVELELDGDAFAFFDPETQRLATRPGNYLIHIADTTYPVEVK